MRDLLVRLLFGCGMFVSEPDSREGEFVGFYFEAVADRVYEVAKVLLLGTVLLKGFEKVYFSHMVPFSE